MVRVYFFITFLLLFCTTSYGQTSSVYFDNIKGDSVVRFYFDANYYLVDKNCEFKSIERVASFNNLFIEFDGFFEDFDTNGRLVLSGTYKEGEKDGLFTAYHANGLLKWKVNFKDNNPIGSWEYYYPDGKPLMRVQHSDSITTITSLWDRNGRLVVKNGTGSFDFSNPIDGFSPYGYSFYRLRGKLKNGVPNGFWRVFYENMGKNDAVQVGGERYENGFFVSGQDYYTDRAYYVQRYSIAPYNNFFRAEALATKGCSFDDFSGFKFFLSDYISKFFLGKIDSESFDFKYTVEVSKDGNVGKTKLLDSISDDINIRLTRAIQSNDVYLPSFKDGEYIDDILTVHGRVLVQDSILKLIYIPQIVREFEHNTTK